MEKPHRLTPLPNLNKEEAQKEKLDKLSARKKMQVTRVVPSSQGLVSDFMSLLHVEMTKLASRIGTSVECLDENESKHLSRLINSLDRLVRIESDVRGLSEVDKMDDKELKSRIQKAVKSLKMSDVDLDKLINK